MKGPCGWKWRLLGLGLVPALFLLAAGCGSRQGTVYGKVTYRGKPLPGGTVTFVGDKGGGAHAEINPADGSYKIEKCPLGTVKVSVEPVHSGPPPMMMMGRGGPPKGAEMPEEMKKGFEKQGQSVTIPENYRDPEKSGITFNVKGGSQPFDIDLK